MNQVKSAIQSHSEKLAVLRHSESLWWDKIGKVVNQTKLTISSHSAPL